MKQKNSTKRTLALSLLVMLLCVAMLVGTTFAWFTDSASTAVNTIQAGTLDIELQYQKADGTWANAEGLTLDFKKAAGHENEAILWEPGCTYELPAVKVVNKGNLALKYKVIISAASGDMALANVLDVKLNGQFTGNTLADVLFTTDSDGFAHGEIGANSETAELKIALHMQESAGNEYQGKSIEGIAITVVATQDTVEYDSTTNQYDKNAEYAIPVATAAELTAALANGQDVILTASIQMPEVIEIKNDVTIYGGENGQLLVPDNADRVINVNDNTEPVTLTLSNVDVVGPTTGTYTRGVSVYSNTDVTIVADNSSVSANYYALNIASDNDNVTATIRNTTLTGWCAFQTWSAGTKATFENCTLIGNNTFSRSEWNDFATVVINTTNVELTFNNCRIEANQTTGNKQYLISIRAAGAKVTMDGCTFFADGTEIASDALKNYIDVYSPQADDFNMSIDGRTLTAGDVFIDV